MNYETLKGAGQSCVIIHHFGAHVTSWKDAAGNEKIYTSPIAIFDGSKAIRGGIPICFPQFGKHGPLRQHGFARNMTWTLDKSFSSTGDAAAVRFILRDDESTRASAWSHSFETSLVITLAADGNSIQLDMSVKNLNEDGKPFSFTTAMHSYFTCDSRLTELSDYDGGQYQDSIDPEEPGKLKVQEGNIVFGKEVDRVYLSTSNTLLLPGLKIEKFNLPDAVVWNPHVEKAAALKDMADDGWKYFICIEPARIVEPATVDTGETWSCSLKLSSI